MLSFFSPLYIYMIGGSRVVTGLLLKTRVAFNCETIEREKKRGLFLNMQARVGSIKRYIIWLSSNE